MGFAHEQMAQALARKIFGAIFDDILYFFENIKASKYDVVVFISRKAYLLYEMVKMCGIKLDEDVQIIYSDRIIKRPSDGQARFKGLNVLLVEDTVNTGGKLNTVLQWFNTKIPEEEKYESVDAVCLACNTDILPHNRGIKSEDFKYLVAMSGREIKDFSVAQVRATHLLGLAYTLELPIYSRQDLTYTKFMEINNTINSIENSGWNKEKYILELDNDGPILQEGSDACFYVPKPERHFTSKISSNVYSEHVSYKHVSYHEDASAEEQMHSISIVPMVLMDCINLNTALYFFQKLSETEELTVKDALVKWLANIKEFAKNDDELLAFNIHKSLTYLLSHCVGLNFSKGTNLFTELTDRASAEKHFGTQFTEDFVYKLTYGDVDIIAGLLHTLTTDFVPEALEKNALTCDMGGAEMKNINELDTVDCLKDAYESYSNSKNDSDFVSRGRKYVRSVSCTFKSQASGKGKYFTISLSQLYHKLTAIPDRNQLIDAGFIMRHVVLHEIDISSFSFDLCYINDGGENSGIMLKKLVPGENSFLAVMLREFHSKAIKFIRAFYLGTGSFDGVMEHADILLEKANPWLIAKGLPVISETADKFRNHFRHFANDENAFNHYLPPADYNEDETEDKACMYYEIRNSGAYAVVPENRNILRESENVSIFGDSHLKKSFVT